jgi:hypothetical protein
MSVIPVAADKTPLIGWKEFQERLATADELRSWWARYPQANVGIVTGVLSNLLVIDIDQPESIEEVEKYLPESLVIPTVKTPRGMHLYFRHVPGVGNLRDVLPGVDVRSEGGYVVCPPSMGGAYSWEVGLENEIPDVPAKLLDILNRATPDIRARRDNRAIAHPGQDEDGINYGGRDDTLFHAALTMAKGGATIDEARVAVLSMAASCNPPFPRDQAIIKVSSAFRRLQQPLMQDIKEWVSVATGAFSARDVSRDLGLSGVAVETIRKNLIRLCDQGVLERFGPRDGTYRPVTVAPGFESINQVEEVKEFKMLWPLGVEDLVSVSTKSISILAGETNSGKTGFLINLCNLNLDLHPITYFSTETTASRFKARIKHLSRPLVDWSRVRFTDKVLTDFHLRIDPDGLNVIDYLEPDVEALWRIGLTIQKIFDALNTGVAIIAIQKKPGADLGYGGSFTSFKSELYMSMSSGDGSRGELKIIKGKTWRTARCNPYLMKKSFYINDGVSFHSDPKRPDWHTGDGGSERDY